MRRTALHPNHYNAFQLGLLFLMMAIFVLPPLCRAELVDRIVAVVNDDIILLSDLDQAVMPLRMQLEKEGYSEVERQIILENQKKKALNGLIDQKLTEQQIKKYGISVSEEQVDNSIERVKAVNNMTDADLQRVLKMEGLSYEAYRQQIRTQMLQSRLINIEVRSKIVVTDQDIKAYYEANHAQYAGQTRYHLRQILLRVDTPLESERQRVYRQMVQIENQLKEGVSFAELARTHSQAPTAADGGDLGFFEGRLLAAPIREALEGLRAGQFTPIVETDQGYQIFLVEDITSTGRSLEEASREIEDKLLAEAREKRFQDWLTELRQRAHIEILE